MLGHKQTDEQKKEEMKKQSEELLEKISGQRLKLKEMREGKTD